MNVQYAVKDEKVYVLEVNPRASRTVPFVSKAIGVPLAKMATKVMLGKTLKELGFTEEIIPHHVAVKESVFPFNRFPGVDVILGPEMKSTGEVMGIDKDFGRAYIKSQIAAGQNLPKKGNVFISVRDRDKRAIVFIAKKLVDLGFHIYSTSGTSAVLEKWHCGKTIAQGCRRQAQRIRPYEGWQNTTCHQYAHRQNPQAGRSQDSFPCYTL